MRRELGFSLPRNGEVYTVVKLGYFELGYGYDKVILTFFFHQKFWYLSNQRSGFNLKHLFMNYTNNTRELKLIK